MNRRDFSKTLLMGGSGLLLAGRAVSGPQPLNFAVIADDINAVPDRAGPPSRRQAGINPCRQRNR
jgi:hypothetical protein